MLCLEASKIQLNQMEMVWLLLTSLHLPRMQNGTPELRSLGEHL